MPERHSKESRLNGTKTATSPCGRQRDPLDVAGRVNDMINCYLLLAGEYIKIYLPLAIISLLLFTVMLFAAYQFLKG